MARNIAVIVGSLRKESYSRKLANALIDLARPTLDMKIVEIADLALYNEDSEAAPPPAWITFRDAVRPVDGVLFVTPEYNRSVPGCLKNAIDIGSRPYGKSVWSGKPAGVISVSMGAMGGFGANQQLRLLLANVNMPTLHQPEVYLGGGDKLFDADGNVSIESTKEFLRTYIEAFAAWVERFAAPASKSEAA